MKCEICNIPFKITEIRKPIYLWGITGVSKVSTNSCTLSGLDGTAGGSDVGDIFMLVTLCW